MTPWTFVAHTKPLSSTEFSNKTHQYILFRLSMIYIFYIFFNCLLSWRRHAQQDKDLVCFVHCSVPPQRAEALKAKVTILTDDRMIESIHSFFISGTFKNMPDSHSVIRRWLSPAFRWNYTAMNKSSHLLALSLRVFLFIQFNYDQITTAALLFKRYILHFTLYPQSPPYWYILHEDKASRCWMKFSVFGVQSDIMALSWKKLRKQDPSLSSTELIIVTFSAFNQSRYDVTIDSHSVQESSF